MPPEELIAIERLSRFDRLQIGQNDIVEPPAVVDRDLGGVIHWNSPRRLPPACCRIFRPAIAATSSSPCAKAQRAPIGCAPIAARPPRAATPAGETSRLPAVAPPATSPVFLRAELIPRREPHGRWARSEPPPATIPSATPIAQAPHRAKTPAARLACRARAL